jgi:peroxiredoxin family protein
MTQKTPADLVLHLHSGDYDRIHQAAAMAAAATALGQRVVVVFYMQALKRLVAGDLTTLWIADDDGEAGELGAGMEAAGAPTPSDLLDQARLSGLLQTVACSASATFWGYTPADLEGRVDTLHGLVTILKNSQGAGTVLYI